MAQRLTMFAVGMMNLSGMALITLLVILEKSMPLEYQAYLQNSWRGFPYVGKFFG